MARATSTDGVAAAISEDKPDLAMVKLHGDDEHALELIEELIDVGGCPVIALLDREDPDFVARAAERGIIAYAQPADEESVKSSLEIAVRRFAELSELGDAVGQLENAIAPARDDRAREGHPHGAPRRLGAGGVRDAAHRGALEQPARLRRGEGVG